eukprot:NODE_2960_length_1306_cov_140.994928_g2811_i0.p1 GENE.NODE_2960_length_1306_cov_140.994928_g2811_i0~~NODE_2960_length_1306_cov_140.994928_g2811_i0.p1  ORF type:complete len:372 (+),score=46.69 NODE_2960_length_1306_cov_140.994928_g2811_i0:66-1181(+)
MSIKTLITLLVAAAAVFLGFLGLTGTSPNAVLVSTVFSYHKWRASRLTLSDPALSWVRGVRPSNEYLALDALLRMGMRAKMANTDDLVGTTRKETAAFGDLLGFKEMQPLVANGVPCYMIEHEGASVENGVILHLHGGGYVAGEATFSGVLLGPFSQATGMRVYTVDYRLAPEHPLPAATDDAIAVYRWLLEDLKVDPSKIAIVGESAGGGLTLLLLQRIKQEKLPQPSCAVPISPYADLANTGSSAQTNRDRDNMIVPDTLNQMGQYAVGNLARDGSPTGRKADLTDPRFSPLYGSFDGLCPMFLLVGDIEILLDDTMRIAEKAQKAGVNVTLEVGPNMCHVYPLFFSIFPEAMQSFGRITGYINRHIRA